MTRSKRLKPIKCISERQYLNAIGTVIDTYHMRGKLSINDICAIQQVVGLSYGRIVLLIRNNGYRYPTIKI